MKRNIKDIKSQKLKQQTININSRNELVEQHVLPKGVPPLKHFEFQFAHESQDEFIEGPKEKAKDKVLNLYSKDEKYFNHEVGIGPVHQDLKLITDKAKGFKELAQRQ